MKMGTTRSPFPYDGCRSPPRAPIGKAVIPYDFALRLAGAAFDFGRVVCLPFDSGPLDQSRDRRDGHKAGSVMPTHDHLVVHLIENGAVEPYSLLRYRVPYCAIVSAAMGAVDDQREHILVDRGR